MVIGLFKINGKGTALLMLIGAVAGSMAVTNASAKSKLDKEISKIDISNLSNLSSEYTYGANANNNSVNHYNLFQTYKIKSKLVLTNEFRHKKVILPKGSVVTGNSDGQGNLVNVDNTTLSIKNQKKVFKKLGNWHYSKTFLKENGAAKYPYVRTTAFSKNSVAAFPMLYARKETSNSDNETTFPFISVTADSQLAYHSKGQVFRATRYAKIKKVKRTHAKITYYLSKRLAGVTTKKVRVGNAYRYRVSLRIGHVFQPSFASDTGSYHVTISNGKQKFYFVIFSPSPVESYLDNLNGKYVTPHEQRISSDYIQSLY
ncbi:MAG: hypothetical protein LKF23_02540 [Levilactobacillus sp.]|uniref:hypothetical protein n=1 Tax=Levilactobacillus sp. TaxID=2767919 RepID=UPI00258C3CD6|nr:hypothetical protein [Levilactobacillus sp.]MCH4123543.1 hypothetical protein [Levilactobacillus sp.]